MIMAALSAYKYFFYLAAILMVVVHTAADDTECLQCKYHSTLIDD